MTTYRSRSETVAQTETVQLRAQFKGPDGMVSDLDAFPTISLIQPSGNVALTPTSSGVYRLSTGLYGYDYTIGINGNIGIWTDVWSGTLDGFTVMGSFNFVVINTQLPHINSDGYEALGDDVGFNYSQVAIHNINIMLKTLRARLNSSGKAKAKDANGNTIYIDCDIFSVDMLVTFLANAITDFNQIPHITFFTFENSDILQQFHDIIVQGAVLMALSSKALIERGREFQITDNGLNFTPPTVSEMLNTQWSAELANHTERLKMIKGNLKPSPISLGLISISSARNPVISQLRHRRARQII